MKFTLSLVALAAMANAIQLNAMVEAEQLT